MIQSRVMIPEQHDGAPRSTELHAAYQRAAQAYAAARREVYDRHGGRAPSREQLSHQQQELLDELASAEAAVDLQRQREWQQVDAGEVRSADHAPSD